MTVWTAIVTSQVFAITLRILLSIGLGALIGLERQLRARSAGIRTNALVSLGSCLFTTVGVYTLAAGTGDPTRVAAQVASGIGFLGAGVILKQGVSVSGLNTAATLWASAAVGTLCGSGMEAARPQSGPPAIMLANMMLRPIGAAIDARRTAQSHEPRASVTPLRSNACVRTSRPSARWCSTPCISGFYRPRPSRLRIFPMIWWSSPPSSPPT